MNPKSHSQEMNGNALPPHLQDYNDRMGFTADYVRALADPRLKEVVALRAPKLLKDIPEFQHCRKWEDYLDVYQRGTLTKAKRRLFLVLMSTVWDKQIPIIEQDIMNQLGLEYIKGRLCEGKNGETEVRQARSMGCIAHLINRYKQSKYVAQLRYVFLLYHCMVDCYVLNAVQLHLVESLQGGDVSSE